MRCEVRLRSRRRCRCPAVLLVVNQRTLALESICRKHAHGRHIYRDHKGAPLRERGVTPDH